MINLIVFSLKIIFSQHNYSLVFRVVHDIRGTNPLVKWIDETFDSANPGQHVGTPVDKHNNINENQIIDFTKDKIAKYKQPKKIIFMDNLPRNSMGKVQKNLLRKKGF